MMHVITRTIDRIEDLSSNLAANKLIYWDGTNIVAVPTTATPQFAGLGLGVAAAATGLKLASTNTIGLGAGKGLMTFTDSTPDTISFDNCNVGIGCTPSYTLHITATIPSIGLTRSTYNWAHSLGSSGQYYLTDISTNKEVLTVEYGLAAGVFYVTSAGNVGIGCTPATSALLELSSTVGALLLTRLTTTQKNALTAVNGMIVYDSTLNKFQGYENGSWTSLI